MPLSVVIISYNEQANIGRTLETVQWADEIIVLDSGSSDSTVDIASSLGAKVYTEKWKGYAAQKNSAIEKASGDWILSLDADESVEPPLAAEIKAVVASPGAANGYWIARKNYFLGRWMRHGGFWPDRKLRLFRRGMGRFEERLVHETAKVSGPSATMKHALVHHAYPTLHGYIETQNRYSTLAAQMAVQRGYRGFSVMNIVVRPLATFFYNYFLRLGFLDGAEGLALHLFHSGYVSWKYSKAWELARRSSHQPSAVSHQGKPPGSD